MRLLTALHGPGNDHAGNIIGGVIILVAGLVGLYFFMRHRRTHGRLGGQRRGPRDRGSVARPRRSNRLGHEGGPGPVLFNAAPDPPHPPPDSGQVQRMKPWQYWVTSAAGLTVCALAGTMLDHALIAPHSWADSAGKGVAILAGGAAGAAVLRLLTRQHH